MDVNHLQRKGWSPAEIARAQKIADAHPHGANERVSLWLLVIVLAGGSMCVAIFLLPLILFSGPFFSIPASLLIGACMGFLLTTSLQTLRVQKEHHVPAAIVLFGGAFLVILFSVWSLERGVTGIPLLNPFLVCVPYMIGLILPYVTERRLHGSS